MSEFIEYKEPSFSIKLPPYLRIQSSGTGAGGPEWYFTVRARDQHPIRNVLVAFWNAQLAADTRIYLLHQRSSTWQGVKQSIIRRGEVDWVRSGFECVLETRNPHTGESTFDYEIVFALKKTFVHVSIFGRHDVEAFRSICKEIVLSIQCTGASRRGPSRGGRISGRIVGSELVRLNKALDSLPPDLEVFRKPILAVARQDQDLLGTGGIDITSLDRALRKIAKGDPVGSKAVGFANRLHRWHEGLSIEDGEWKAPIIFVESCLRGRPLFGGGAD